MECIYTPNEYLPNSPDMNPIELVFGYWHSKVTSRNPRNIDELISICKEEWNAIPLKVVRNSIKRVIKVMKWVMNIMVNFILNKTYKSKNFED